MKSFSKVPKAIHKKEAKLKTAVVEVWVLDIQRALKDIPTMLSKAELKALEKMKSPKARSVFEGARKSLRWLLERYLGTPGRKIKFSHGRHGKPRIAKPKTGLHFNISHSGEKIILAFSKSQVGVDIEKRLPRKSFGKLAKKCFSTKNQQKLKALKGKKRINFFYRVWTASEAYLKNLGESVYAIEHIREKIRFSRANESQLRLGKYRLTCFELDDNYAAAISVKTGNPEIRLFEI